MQEVMAHCRSEGARRWNGFRTRREGGVLGKGLALWSYILIKASGRFGLECPTPIRSVPLA